MNEQDPPSSSMAAQDENRDADTPQARETEASDEASVQSMMMEWSRFSCPFPPPEYLARYPEPVRKQLLEAIAAESKHRRKLEQDEADHRRQLETGRLDLARDDARSARKTELVLPIIAFGACGLLMLTGVILVAFGSDTTSRVVGGIVSGGSIAGVVTAFLKFEIRKPIRESSGNEPAQGPS